MKEKLQAPSGNEGKAHAHMYVGSRTMQEHIAERPPTIKKATTPFDIAHKTDT